MPLLLHKDLRTLHSIVRTSILTFHPQFVSLSDLHTCADVDVLTRERFAT